MLYGDVKAIAKYRADGFRKNPLQPLLWPRDDVCYSESPTILRCLISTFIVEKNVLKGFAILLFDIRAAVT